MEISPLFLTLLLLGGFLFGIFLGILNDGNRIVRVFLGVRYSKKHFRSLYERPLPIVHRPLRVTEGGRIRRGVLGAVIFLQDLLLFVVGGVGCVLLQYEYNSGRFRFFLLPAIVFGFLLYYFTVGKCVMLVSEAIAFGIKATFCILGSLCMRPVVKIFRFFVKNLKKTTGFFQFLIAKRTKKLYNIHKKQEWLHMAEVGCISLDTCLPEDT